MADQEGRPVLSGLGALVTVALVVGLVLAAGVLAVTQVLGLGGSSASSGTATSGSSMYLPKPQQTEPETDPDITLAPSEEETSAEPTRAPTKTAQRAIRLTAEQREVGVLERIDLNGVYPTGDGAILQVERFQEGAWAEFQVTISVRGGTFATYLQTSRVGVNKFRVRDTRTDEASNPVTITVG